MHGLAGPRHVVDEMTVTNNKKEDVVDEMAVTDNKDEAEDVVDETQAPLDLRNYFPETWLWELYTIPQRYVQLR